MIETNFKHTRIGTYPANWKIEELREHLVLLTDYDANGSFADMANNVTTYLSPNYAWYVRATDLEQNSPLSEVHYTDEASYKFLRKSSLFGGEVLLAKRGDIGKVYLFKAKTAKATLGPNLYLLKLQDSLLSSYLYCYFKSPAGQRNLKAINASTSLGAIYKDDVKALLIPIPPTLAEQERIAGALSSIDTLIGALNEQIEKKRHIKQGTMQQLLTGKKRLAGFTGEWVTEIIKDICDRYDHLRIPVAANFRIKGLTPYYGANGIQDYVDGYTHDGEFILLAEDGANNLVDYPIRYVSGKIWVNNHAHVLSAKEKKADTRFLAYVLKTIDFESNIVGSGRAKLNAETLMQLEVSIPPTIAEQSAIAAVLSGMDTEIAALEQKRDKYIVIKSGMMQDLLTGKIRLV